MQILLRNFLVFFLILSHATSFTQRTKKGNKAENLLAGTTWKVNGIPFENKDTRQYIFSTFDSNDFEDRWGYFITFDKTTFSSSYSARCGNDCFTAVTGEYYFKSAFKIHVRVNAISRSGYCDKESETLNSNYGFYLLEKTGNGWIINKEKLSQ